MSLKAWLKGRLSDSQFRQLRNLSIALRSVGHRSDLTRLAQICNADKWGTHFYTPHYMRHLKAFRRKRIRLLEIGVGGHDDPKRGGASLRMWKQYFPFATIFSIDVYDKSLQEESRIKIFTGSQADPEFLQDVVAQTGPLDVIIDDGSHVNSHVIGAFEALFPALRDGGIYVVEDTQTSYWPDFGGDSDDLTRADTLMNFFKGLVDGLNHVEFMRPDYRANYYDKHIVAMHFYHNMVFIYKGENDEASNLVRDHTRQDV